MKKLAVVFVFVLCAIFLLGCGESDKSSSSSDSKTTPSKTSSESPEDTEFANWLISGSAADLNADETITEDDYALWQAFDAWRDTDDAVDYTKDRRITFADYTYFTAFKTWKLSDSSIDLNGDSKITVDDYDLFLNPEKVTYIAWMDSENAADLNEDGVVDERDYQLTEKYLQFIGSFRILHWEIGDEVPYFLDSEFSLSNFVEYAPDITFTMDKYGNISWVVPQAMREALGSDWTTADNAVRTAVMEKISSTLAKISLSAPSEDVALTVYLALSSADAGDYSGSFSYTYDDLMVEASFDIVYE